MIAARFGTFGGPDVLRVEDVPAPRAPTGDEILVEVAASSVNGTDLGLRRGDLKVATWGRLPFTPGFDLAGTVLGCGPAVTAFVPGEQVMALLDHGGGGQAQQVLVRQGRAAVVPTRCTSQEAAALPLAGLTALQALYGRARLGTRPAGARVLVIGATGGIGSFGVQLAAIAGAHVTAVGSAPKLHAMTGLGAHATLDRRSDDLFTGGERWDVVLDAHGATTARHAGRLLRPGGVLVTSRPISRDAIVSRVLPALAGPGRRFTSVMTSARSADLARLARLVDEERLRVLLDSTFPLGEVAAAHRRAEGSSTGKVVVRIRPASA